MSMRRVYKLFCSNVWLISVGVLFAYSLLTVIMTWPVAVRLNTHLVGTGDDMWVHYWNGWWVKQVLQQGGNVYYTPLLFHPAGVSLLYHNFAWVNIAVWLLLEPLVGGIAAYNLAHLLHIPLCGVGMFLLAHHLTKSNAIAFVGGLIFAFWPYRMADVNHPNTVSTELLPILMLVLLRLFGGGKPLRNGVIAGVLLALIGYMRWQLLILAGFMVVLYLLYTLVWERGLWTWRTVGGLVLAGVVMGILIAPPLFPIVQEYATGESPDEIYAASLEDREQDILAWFIPQRQHPLAASLNWVFPKYGFSDLRYRHSAFVGFVAVGLAVIGVAKRRKKQRTWFWVGMAVLCFILALGPHLWFNGRCTNVPLPYKLIEWLPPVQMLGHPRRFSALLGLSVAVLAGYGALGLREWLLPHRISRRVAHSVAFIILLALLILVDYLSTPMSTVSARVPAFLAALADQPDDFAVMGLPGRRHCTEYYMFYQTVHGHPILGGHVSRLPSQALEFASSIPLIDRMYEQGGINTEPSDISRQFALLAEAGFRYIVVDKRLAEPKQVREWRSYLVMSPRYEDEEVVVYSTTPVAGRDFSLKRELGAGVGLIEADLSVEGVRPGNELELDVIWSTTASPRAGLQVEVALVNEGGEVEQAQRFELSPSWPTGEWPANAIVRARYALTFGVELDGGGHSVVLRLLRDGQPVGQEVQVGEVEIQLPERHFTAPAISQEIGAAFGGDLRLLGYDLRTDMDALHITLHWQALRKMDTNYTMFVHLFDATSGEIVSQVDVMPYGFTYFTAWWKAEEVVSDEIVVPLDEVPSGTYSLAVGVYDADTGERLKIAGQPTGLVVEEDRLILPDEVVR
jgi:hypothetical protein